ncbi:MAG TPA: GWxTD domain-containing protein [Candidatus Kapabacteria bacterium]|nr:GWxTD domain-containing protein [Candidatus Kapabacteria bacterium]
MNRPILTTVFAFVLLQLIVSVSYAQQSADSTIVFPQKDTSVVKPVPERPRLSGILSTAIGSYNGFDKSGRYLTFLQPNFGFDFLAEPSPGLHLLFGGRIGIPVPITTEVLFGVRFPIHDNSDHSTQIFADAALLFVDDILDTAEPRIGFRGAFGARTFGSVDLEYRLAAEYRGTGQTAIDELRTRPLWWVGAEFGIALGIVGSSRQLTRKDSLRASLHYIATSEEMDEFDAITSNLRLDDWLERFWKRRDMTPGTYTNEARIEFERRTRRANELFSSSRRLGVMTDPGRVILIYGFPEDNEAAQSESNENHRYVMWIYHRRVTTQPLAVFLFQTDAPREWKQVYSNVPGELTGVLPTGLPVYMTRWIQ